MADEAAQPGATDAPAEGTAAADNAAPVADEPTEELVELTEAAGTDADPEHKVDVEQVDKPADDGAETAGGDPAAMVDDADGDGDAQLETSKSSIADASATIHEGEDEGEHTTDADAMQGGEAGEFDDEDLRRNAAATRIAAVERGRKARSTSFPDVEHEDIDDDGLADPTSDAPDDGPAGEQPPEEYEGEEDMYGDEEGYGDFEMLQGTEENEADEADGGLANLTELFQQAEEEKAAFAEMNQNLQRKLAEHLRTVKKSDETKDTETAVTDQDQRYFKCLAQVNELRDELRRVETQYDKAAMEAKRRLEDKEKKAAEIKDAFLDFKREIFKGAENSRTGKPIPPKMIKAFEESEIEKDNEVEKMRLANINRRNTLRKLEHTLKQKEKLAEGLHLIDFEQLKIENQTLNEKIEERNEELLKLRKKTTTTVQVLTHLKEKLQFVQAENQILKHNLADLEIELTSKRDILTQAKHERDALRADNTERKQHRGLVSSEDLLVDFEKRRLAIIAKAEEVAALQQKHKALVERVSSAKKRLAASGRAV
mmetsp:Transcript_53665/g.117027  ORF Transcript_53665/g.117027 Transcript_53665/m.117027 type:complete len:543 (-) Transcript_53665:426-2054(-)